MRDALSVWKLLGGLTNNEFKGNTRRFGTTLEYRTANVGLLAHHLHYRRADKRMCSERDSGERK